MGKKLEEDEGVEGGVFLVFQMRVMTTSLYTDRKIQ